MTESPNEPDEPKDAVADPAGESAPPSAPAEPTPPAEPAPPAETPDAANPPPDPAAADSATFSRCAECKNAEGVNSAAGTLVCTKHNMLINAEADEIPDDCVEHEPKDGAVQSAECTAQSAEDKADEPKP